MVTRLLAMLICSFIISAAANTARGQSQSALAASPPNVAVPCPNSLMTMAEATTMLEGHNLYRRELRLRDLVWDCRLAGNAQQWANKRVTEHDEFSPFGESIFVATSSTIPIAAAIAGWVGEKPNWNNQTARCAAGKACTHYTQMVWRTTTKIGCGVIRNGPGKWKTFLVCNYEQAGNTGGPAY